MQGVTEGRIVHVVLADGATHRPAIITNAWGNGGGEKGTVNVTIFTDWANDKEQFGSGEALAWGTSIPYSETKEANTWHWPEKE